MLDKLTSQKDSMYIIMTTVDGIDIRYEIYNFDSPAYTSSTGD